MKRILLLTTFSIFLFSTVFGQNDSTIMIKGQIDTIPGAVFYLSYLKGDLHVEDTLSIDKEGKFEYTTISQEPLRAFISLDNHPDKPWYDSTLVGKYTLYYFWTEPNKITHLKGKKKNEQEVENSAIENQILRYSEKLDQALVGINKLDEKRVIDSFRRAYIVEEPTYHTLLVMNYMLSRTNPDLSLIKEVYNQLPSHLKQTGRANEIKRQLFIKENTSIGKAFPDFQINDVSGDLIRLREFRGKYVLVDFWASWCAPCRREHPYLRQAYNQFNTKGFEIIGISLDDNKADWLKAIKDDELTWTQASDLKAFRGELVNELYIRAIPENYLIDPDGVIIAKGLRGEKLLEVLNKLPL